MYNAVAGPRFSELDGQFRCSTRKESLPAPSKATRRLKGLRQTPRERVQLLQGGGSTKQLRPSGSRWIFMHPTRNRGFFIRTAMQLSRCIFAAQHRFSFLQDCPRVRSIDPRGKGPNYTCKTRKLKGWRPFLQRPSYPGCSSSE